MSIFGGRKQPPPSSDTSDFPLPASGSQQPVGFETVLGASSTLKGEFECHANVRLDGTFEGTLTIEGNVLVGETAKITADIHAQNVAIAGAVRGNVSGKKVQLLRTARVWGDITAAAIATESGAFIDGKITMISHEAADSFDQPPRAVAHGDEPAAPVPESSGELSGAAEEPAGESGEE
jgi:cytoskeletal protein CcmA (bactofilin family)